MILMRDNDLRLHHTVPILSYVSKSVIYITLFVHIWNGAPVNLDGNYTELVVDVDRL